MSIAQEKFVVYDPITLNILGTTSAFVKGMPIIDCNGKTITIDSVVKMTTLDKFLISIGGDVYFGVSEREYQKIT